MVVPNARFDSDEVWNSFQIFSAIFKLNCLVLFSVDQSSVPVATPSTPTLPAPVASTGKPSRRSSVKNQTVDSKGQFHDTVIADFGLKPRQPAASLQQAAADAADERRKSVKKRPGLIRNGLTWLQHAT